MRIKKHDKEKYREIMKRKHPRNDRVRMSEKAYRKRKKKQVFETPRPCEECGKMFDRWFSLNEHKKIHKKFDVPQDCPMCDKKFEYKNSFLQHKKWHCTGGESGSSAQGVTTGHIVGRVMRTIRPGTWSRRV